MAPRSPDTGHAAPAQAEATGLFDKLKHGEARLGHMPYLSPARAAPQQEYEAGVPLPSPARPLAAGGVDVGGIRIGG